MKTLQLITYDGKMIQISLNEISRILPTQWGHPETRTNVILVELHADEHEDERKYYICLEVYPTPTED